MPSCVINRCKNNSCLNKKSAGITFHKFPTDMAWKNRWIRSVRDNRNSKDWLPSKFSVVCSLHFEECDIYNTNSSYCRIKKNAAPKKVHLVYSEWCQKLEQSGIQPEYQTASVKTEPCDIEENVGAMDNFCHISVNFTKNNSKPQEHIQSDCEMHDSDVESIFDSPHKNVLRQQARKYRSRCNIYAQKIKTLNQKVRRLKMRNATLKRVLKDLKEKKYILTPTKYITVMKKIMRTSPNISLNE